MTQVVHMLISTVQVIASKDNTVSKFTIFNTMPCLDTQNIYDDKQLINMKKLHP